jgi:hypothetical protein
MMRRGAAVAALIVVVLVLAACVVALIVKDSAGPVSLVISALIAGGIFALLLRLDVNWAVETLEFSGVALPVFGFLIFSAVTDPQAGGKEFAEVGAQIIIVLLLALAIEARFFHLRAPRDRLDRVASLFTMIVLAAGEFYALQGIAAKHPTNNEMVAGAIAAGFVAVAVSALLGPTRTGDS